jgi:toxin ParE1/3/4
MAHRVVWSEAAIRDVESIGLYIEHDSPAYARSVVRKLLGAGRHLQTFPFSGRMVPEAGEQTIREIFVYGYRLIFRVTADSVVFLTVVHSKQDLSGLSFPNEAE